MHRTQKYSIFVYFKTIFVYFETPWAMNRHFMSKKKRAQNHPVKGHALPAGQRPTNFDDNKT